MARTHVDEIVVDDDLDHDGTAGWTDPRARKKRRPTTALPKAVEVENSVRECDGRTARQAAAGDGGARGCRGGEHRRIDCSDGLAMKRLFEDPIGTIPS